MFHPESSREQNTADRRPFTGFKKKRKPTSEIRLGETEYTYEEQKIGTVEILYEGEVMYIFPTNQEKEQRVAVREIKDIRFIPAQTVGDTPVRKPFLLSELSGIPSIKKYVPVERLSNYSFVRSPGQESYVLCPPIESTVDTFILLHELGHVAQLGETEFKAVDTLRPKPYPVGPNEYVPLFGAFKQAPTILSATSRYVTPEVCASIDRYDATATQLADQRKAQLERIDQIREELIDLEDAEEDDVEMLLETLLAERVSLPELVSGHDTFISAWEKNERSLDVVRELERTYIQGLAQKGIQISRRLCAPGRNPFAELFSVPKDLTLLPSGIQGVRFSFGAYGDIVLFDPESAPTSDTEVNLTLRIDELTKEREELERSVQRIETRLERLHDDELHMLDVTNRVRKMATRINERDASRRALVWAREAKKRGFDLTSTMQVPWAHTIDGGMTEVSEYQGRIILSSHLKPGKGPNVLRNPVGEAEAALDTYSARLKAVRAEHGGKVPKQLLPKEKA